MTTVYQAPTPAEVGEFYNRMNQLLARFQGGSIHYGYWTGPDDDSSFEQASERLTDIVVGKLAVGPGDRVLDLGCGTGKPAIQLARGTGAHVVGVSISTSDIEVATALATAEGMQEQVTFQHGNAVDLDLPAASFDAVLAIELLVHVPDRLHVLKQIARVLRPGGRLALTDFVKRGPETHNEELEAALTEALAAFASGPLAREEDFPLFAKEAGLELDEIVDITDNTAGYSYPRTLEAVREYTTKRHEDAPADVARILAALSTPDDWQVPEEEMGGEGVIIVVAHLPETP